MIKNKALPIVLIVAVLGISFFLWHNRTVNNLSDQEIRKKFNCITDPSVPQLQVIRLNKYYCVNPDAYRKGQGIPNEYCYKIVGRPCSQDDRKPD